MSRWILGLVLSALVATALPAAAQEDDEARVHFRLGRAYYDSGRFEEAAREFQQAYDLSQRATLLYNVFIAWRDAGQLGPAIEALELYLARVPDAPERDNLEARLASMRRLHQQQAAARTASQTRETGTQGTTTTTTTTTTGATSTETTPAETTGTTGGTSEPDTGDDTRPAPPDLRPAGGGDGGGAALVPWIVIGVGGAVVIAGAVTGAMALSAESELEEMCPMDECPDDDFVDTRDSGQTLATVTDILLVTGVLAVGAGVALLFLLDDSSPVESYPDASASAACTPDGCALTFRSSF